MDQMLIFWPNSAQNTILPKKFTTKTLDAACGNFFEQKTQSNGK